MPTGIPAWSMSTCSPPSTRKHLLPNFCTNPNQDVRGKLGNKSEHEVDVEATPEKRKGRKVLTFSDEEQKMLKKAFYVDGQASSGSKN